MNADILEGRWTSLKGEVKSKWAELADDELASVEGDVQKLIGAVQEKYGFEREKARAEVNEWLSSLKD